MTDMGKSASSELSIELKKIEIQEREQRLKRWANPLSVGIATAIIAFGGQWITTTITSQNAAAQLEQEKLKFEYESLEKAFSAYASGRESQAMKMLSFYSKLGLIKSNTDQDVRNLINEWVSLHQLKMDEFHRLTVPELEKRVGETKSVDKQTEW